MEEYREQEQGFQRLGTQELNFGFGKLEICAPFLKGIDMIHQVILQWQGPEREDQGIKT